MVLSFSKTYDVYDYLFINNRPIEHVANFKYIGTVFSNDLKWHANTEVLYSMIKSRFYVFLNRLAAGSNILYRVSLFLFCFIT